MTHPKLESGDSRDPRGSNFLRKNRDELFAALLGRNETGGGVKRSEAEKWEIYDRYKKERDSELGDLAIKAL